MSQPLIPAGLALLLLTAACARPYYVGSDGVRVGSDRPPSSGVPASSGGSTATPELTRKRVESKEPPGTLSARDGTVCTVTAARYAEIQEGEYVWCASRFRR